MGVVLVLGRRRVVAAAAVRTRRRQGEKRVDKAELKASRLEGQRLVEEAKDFEPKIQETGKGQVSRKPTLTPSHQLHEIDIEEAASYRLVHTSWRTFIAWLLVYGITLVQCCSFYVT